MSRHILDDNTNFIPNVALQKSSLKGWLVADLSTTRTIVPTEDPDTDAMYIGNYELPGVESYYWLAPPALGGSQIGLYGGVTLNFTVGWEAMRGDTSGQPTVGPNIILVVRCQPLQVSWLEWWWYGPN